MNNHTSKLGDRRRRKRNASQLSIYCSYNHGTFSLRLQSNSHFVTNAASCQCVRVCHLPLNTTEAVNVVWFFFLSVVSRPVWPRQRLRAEICCRFAHSPDRAFDHFRATKFYVFQKRRSTDSLATKWCNAPTGHLQQQQVQTHLYREGLTVHFRVL